MGGTAGVACALCIVCECVVAKRGRAWAFRGEVHILGLLWLDFLHPCVCVEYLSDMRTVRIASGRSSFPRSNVARESEGFWLQPRPEATCRMQNYPVTRLSTKN